VASDLWSLKNCHGLDLFQTFIFKRTKKTKKKHETKTHAARSHIVLITLSFVTLSKPIFTITQKGSQGREHPKHADTKLNLNIIYDTITTRLEVHLTSRTHTQTFLFFLRRRRRGNKSAISTLLCDSPGLVDRWKTTWN